MFFLQWQIIQQVAHTLVSSLLKIFSGLPSLFFFCKYALVLVLSYYVVNLKVLWSLHCLTNSVSTLLLLYLVWLVWVTPLVTWSFLSSFLHFPLKLLQSSAPMVQATTMEMSWVNAVLESSLCLCMFDVQVLCWSDQYFKWYTMGLSVG